MRTEQRSHVVGADEPGAPCHQDPFRRHEEICTLL
jgi:hypothetical protein